MSRSPLDPLLRHSERRRLRRLEGQANYIASLEPDYRALSDEDLAAKTGQFKERLVGGETLEEVLFEAYAAVREAARRELGLLAFPVQIMGAIALHEGDIAEMKTGEGKTLVATMPLYLNSLAGRGVHLVTANDYLAERDCEWMGGVYRRLGVTAAAVTQATEGRARKEAYAADITYGTNTEFGFDYLRDNMSPLREGQVQRGHSYAIVDEVDSILIDEARTPLIISGEPQVAADTYYAFARIAKRLQGVAADPLRKGQDPDVDYEYDEKHKTVAPFQSAIEKVERELKIDNLYDPRHSQLVNHLIQSLKAQALYQLDVDYVIQDGEVKIVDEFTGRIMEGRRWSEGLHQAVEAKEGVAIQEEHVTMATITLQNYFRLYDRLAGMTGTAKTEEKEFAEIYGLEVVEIPTNVEVGRRDENDLIFKTREGKFAAVIRDIVKRHEAGQPVLVGTIAVETSEYLSQLLTRKGVPHNVLNAKEHAREAEIIAGAGLAGAVTIATNMAGRGVDIKIDNEVRALGGLYVLGTERHESRRIDNQLRGRSGRQGDPGESRFYLSAEDNLVRLFGGERISSIMERFHLPADQPMQSGILSRQVEGAQKKVEELAFSARKEVLKYDDVLNVQRAVIYGQRQRVLEGEDLSADIKEAVAELIAAAVNAHTDSDYAEEWDLEGLRRELSSLYDTEILVEEIKGLEQSEIIREAVDDAFDALEDKEQSMGSGNMRNVERYLMLTTVDTRWREHLEAMEYLRQGIHLRSMAQKNPLVEYRHEGHVMFEALGQTIREEVARVILMMKVEAPEAAAATAYSNARAEGQTRTDAGVVAGLAALEAEQGLDLPGGEKVGRNAPCPCGSGKKYKKCHGLLAPAGAGARR